QSRQYLQQRTNNVPIDLFERLDLFLHLAFVRGLVGRFDMHASQIMIGQSGNGGPALGRVIGIEISSRTRHINALPTQQPPDTANKIDGADDRAARAINFRKRLQVRSTALPPEPNLRGGALARRAPCLVYWMIAERVAAQTHETFKH